MTSTTHCSRDGIGPTGRWLRYASAFNVGLRRGRSGRASDRVEPSRELLLIAIAILLVVPVFVQLSSGLFIDKAMVFDAAGAISRLPFPLSAAGVLLGIVLLGNYTAAIRTMGTVFFTAALFVMGSVIVAAGDRGHESAKLMLLAQFLLPMLGLVLGEMYGAATSKPWFERAAAAVMLAVIPLQLLATWDVGYILPQPHVFFFSIYQHLQYFPMIVMAVSIMATMALLRDGTVWSSVAMLLWPFALLHGVASVSIAAVVGGLAGLALFVLWHGVLGGAWRKVLPSAVVAVLLATSYAVLSNSGVLARWVLEEPPVVIKELRWEDKLSAAKDTLGGASAFETPRSEAGTTEKSHSRLFYWHAYAVGATSSLEAFLFGQASPLDRKHFPSAHNYWLDALYNFGIVALLPLLALMIVTFRMAWQRRSAFRSDPALAGCLLAMMYLVLGENMFKVGMRQPYPGVITMFIWGLLISRLRAHPVDAEACLQPRP